MAVKKSNTKRRTAKRITLTEMLNVVEAAYDPEGMLERRFAEIGSEDGRIPVPALTDDTLAEFLIREMGSVFNHRAGKKTNLNIAADAVYAAIVQLRAVMAALQSAEAKA